MSFRRTFSLMLMKLQFFTSVSSFAALSCCCERNKSWQNCQSCHCHCQCGNDVKRSESYNLTPLLSSKSAFHSRFVEISHRMNEEAFRALNQVVSAIIFTMSNVKAWRPLERSERKTHKHGKHTFFFSWDVLWGGWGGGVCVNSDMQQVPQSALFYGPIRRSKVIFVQIRICASLKLTVV